MCEKIQILEPFVVENEHFIYKVVYFLIEASRKSSRTKKLQKSSKKGFHRCVAKIFLYKICKNYHPVLPILSASPVWNGYIRVKDWQIRDGCHDNFTFVIIYFTRHQKFLSVSFSRRKKKLIWKILDFYSNFWSYEVLNFLN